MTRRGDGVLAVPELRVCHPDVAPRHEHRLLHYQPGHGARAEDPPLPPDHPAAPPHHHPPHPELLHLQHQLQHHLRPRQRHQTGLKFPGLCGADQETATRAGFSGIEILHKRQRK